MPKKDTTLISVCCAVCDKEHGAFLKKDIPESFICSGCGLAQKFKYKECVGYTRKRNYPLGFWS